MTITADELIQRLNAGTAAVLENTLDVIRCHGPEQCANEYCCVHKRSDHHMRHFPQHWRADRYLMERICPHGCGHPDPDDMSLLAGEYQSVHGCDGCCADPSAE